MITACPGSLSLKLPGPSRAFLLLISHLRLPGAAARGGTIAGPEQINLIRYVSRRIGGLSRRCRFGIFEKNAK
jgi:hypothetical protein